MEPTEQLPKIGEGLQFPILEEIPAVKPKDDEKPKQKVKPSFSMAKKKFNQMAFSVLAQIIDEKQKAGDEDEEEDGPKEDEPKSEDKPTEDDIPEIALESASPDLKGRGKSNSITPRTGGISVTPRRSEKTLSRQGSASSLATIDSTATRTSTVKKKSKKGPSFMSVIRLANYRRKAGGKGLLGRKGGAASVASSLGDLDEDDENIRELPNEPRFCATLSTEAQYAMLKCYEDVLLESIRTTKPKEPVPDDATLYRVKTPNDGSLQSLRLAGGNKDGGKLILPQLTGPKEDVPDAAKPPSRESERRGSVSSSIHLPTIVNTKTRPMSRNSTSSLAPFLQGKLQVVPKDKQLRLSYRFQTAMDILDAVREIRGQVVTTPRAVKLGEINPMRNYNQWSKGWSKEFQYEFKDSQGNMKT